MTPTDLRTARKALGLTQAELAARLGLSRSVVADYERGAAVTPRIVMLAIAALSSGAAAPQREERS